MACRLLSAFIYQCELNSRTNETLPQDPEEMRKVLQDKYPHKYPPQYRPGKRSSSKPVKPSKFNQKAKRPTTSRSTKRPAGKTIRKP